jgi:hypothetical protein
VKADKSKLINRPRVDDGVVNVPDVGEFRIRQLTRAEVLRVYETKETVGLAESEILLLHLALTEPAFTLEEVREWYDVPGATTEIQPLSQAIGQISGMMPSAGKDAYKSAGG